MAPYQALDDLIREYLLFRGFASTLKAFDIDIKAEKEKGFRADRITDQMLQHVTNHDLGSLRELWQHLNNKLFRRLDPTQTASVGRLESGFLKLYVINCIQTRHHDKLKDFFERMANELQGQHEWREWFALPFLISPASSGGGYGSIDSNPIFSAYFSRQWQDTLLLSFHNFLMLMFASMPAPRLADYWSTAIKLKKLKEENQVMRRKLGELQRNINKLSTSKDHDQTKKVHIPDVPAHSDIMDDFYIIAQENNPTNKDYLADNASSETQVKSLTKFLRNITGVTTTSSINSGSSNSLSSAASSAPSFNTSQMNKDQHRNASAFTSSNTGKELRERALGDHIEENSQSHSRPSSRGKIATNQNSKSASVFSSTTIHAPLSRLAERSVSQLTPGSLVSNITDSPISSTEQDGTPINVPDLSLQVNGPTKFNTTNSTDSEHLEYLLLSQEEYQEHHSEVTQCKFSTSSGYLIASGDIEGVIKIWSAGPPGPPHTLATFISNSAVTSLEWMPNSDSNFVYGTTSGNIRVCDQLQRKTTCDIDVTSDQSMDYGQVQRHENACSIQQISVSPSGSTLAASISLDNKYSVQGSGPHDTNNHEGSLVLYDLRTSTRLSEYEFGKSLLPASTMGSNFETIITSLTFNHNSQLLITGGNDGKIRIFDLRKRGDCISSWTVGSNDLKYSSILTIHPSIDDTSIYTLSKDGYFSTWSIVQTSQKIFGALINDPYFTSGKYPNSAFSKQFAIAGNDGKHVLACSSTGGILYKMSNIETNTMENVLELRGHKTHLTCTDWSASNDCGPCVTAGNDGQIRVSTMLSQ